MKSKNEIRQEELKRSILIANKFKFENTFLEQTVRLEENKLAVKNERGEVLKLINECDKRILKKMKKDGTVYYAYTHEDLEELKQKLGI